MKMRSTAPMYVAKTGSAVMSAVYCALGILFIVRPDFTVRAAGRLLGASMAIFGAFKLVGYFSRDLYRLAFQYDWALGILLAVSGALLLTRPAGAVTAVFLIMGVTALAGSLFKARIALDARAFGIRSWWAIFVLSILTAAVGLLLLFRPWDSARVMTVLLGVSLLTQGLLDLCVTLGTVKIVPHQYPDVIDVDYVNLEESESE